jgi:hypothetical protein
MGGIFTGIEQCPAVIWLGNERRPINESFANYVSCKHRKLILFMLAANGAQSAAAKAKNINLARENHLGIETPFQVLALLPFLPPPGRKHI